MDVMLNTLRSLFMVWVLGSVSLILLTEIPHQNVVQHFSVQDSYIVLRPLFDSRMEQRRLRGTVDIQKDVITTVQPIKCILDFHGSFEGNGFDIRSVDRSITRSYDEILDKLWLSHVLGRDHILSVVSDDELGIINKIVGDFAKDHNLELEQITHLSTAMMESSDNAFTDIVFGDIARRMMGDAHGKHGNDGYYPLTLLIPINNLDDYFVAFVNRNIPSSLAGHYRCQQRIPPQRVLFLNEETSMHYLAFSGSDRADSKAITITLWAHAN